MNVNSEFSLIVGPCAIESREMFAEIAHKALGWGAMALRGGVYKMRTDPRSFQGLGDHAFEIVAEVKAETGLPFVCEVTDPRQIERLAPFVDVFQVGTRNMHNYELLKELGRGRAPVLLKRGLAAYLDEFLLAAEYVQREGNSNVILCERGVRTFEKVTRNTLDLSAVPYLKERSGLRVYVDPSHATGRKDLVAPMCWAAAAAGADGLLIEVHPDPTRAMSDGPQALTYEDMDQMLARLVRILDAMDRSFKGSVPSCRIPLATQDNPVAARSLA